MRFNRVKKLWREGKPAVGGWLSIPHSVQAEVMELQAKLSAQEADNDAATLGELGRMKDMLANLPELKELHLDGLQGVTPAVLDRLPKRVTVKSKSIQ